jgi:hypothetical protein
VQVMRCVGSEAARTPHRQAGFLTWHYTVSFKIYQGACSVLKN